ncbi:MAG: hypothetical protein IMZ53_04890 [Thermoplasmata archaeon]|nr:hypothetical protein [Thermoplasmata archaeon]
MDDSGKRHEFNTGAVRDSAEDKPRPDLISPYAQLRVGAWLALGAKKYAERNWEKGMTYSRCVASICRHLFQYMAGFRNEDHVAAIACNAQFIMHYDEMIKKGVLPAELDDMPKYEQHEITTELITGDARVCPVEDELHKTVPEIDTLVGEANKIYSVRAVKRCKKFSDEKKAEIIRNILAVPESARTRDFETGTILMAFRWSGCPQETDYWSDVNNTLSKEKCYG